MIPFMMLGMLGGLIGVFFIRSCKQWNAYKKTSKIRNYPITEVNEDTCCPHKFTLRITIVHLLMCCYSCARVQVGVIMFITAAVSYQSLYLRGTNTNVLAVSGRYSVYSLTLRGAGG